MPTSQPNLLFIMDDQHRYDYLGCAGADFVRTPHMDRLAARGVRFSQCATNSPICAPTRIALASGLMAHRVAPFDNASFLSHNVPTYYQRLRDHGYRVGCVGKLDLAKPDGYNGRYGDRPVVYSWGFTHPEECEGKMHGGRSPEPRGPYGFFLQERGLYETFHRDYVRRMVEASSPDDQTERWIETQSHDSVLPVDAFEDVYIGQRAAEWIEQVPDDFPWHYFVSFVGPHDPFDPPSEYAERYRDAAVPDAIPYGMDGKPAWVQRRAAQRDPDNTATVRRQYCALIELIDTQIGRILDALERRNMLENTVIVFASDHGEMLGDHGLYQKSAAYEPALRVPLIVAGPGVAEGVVSDALVELFDVNPTLCELAGLPPQAHIDARSFAPILRGERDEHRSEQITSMHNFRAIRTGTHKLIESYNDVTELYDLAADPQERHNIAGEAPEQVQALGRRMRRCMNAGKWLR